MQELLDTGYPEPISFFSSVLQLLAHFSKCLCRTSILSKQPLLAGIPDQFSEELSRLAPSTSSRAKAMAMRKRMVQMAQGL